MKIIELSKTSPSYKGKYFTQVDDEDYEELSKHEWNVHVAPHTCYVFREFKRKRILMHRFLLGLTDRKIQCDHIDHDGLNNQRYNLRTCSCNENQRNRRSRKNSTSKYLGVCFLNIKTKRKLKSGEEKIYIHKCYVAQIAINKKVKHIGTFQCEEDAAKAYDKAAKEIHGEFANLNFKE